jgi:tetratricopeptide (TPR) repeat protein
LPVSFSNMSAATEALDHGRQARTDGNLPEAREFYAEAARLYREQNDSLAYAHTIRHIADIHRKEGSFSEARPLYEEALELYRDNHDTKLLDLANAIRPYAMLLEVQGDQESAINFWKEASHLYGSLRIDEGVSECDTHLSKLQNS